MSCGPWVGASEPRVPGRFLNKGFRGLGFKVQGFRGFGFKVPGFRGLELKVQGLGV